MLTAVSLSPRNFPEEKNYGTKRVSELSIIMKSFRLIRRVKTQYGDERHEIVVNPTWEEVKECTRITNLSTEILLKIALSGVIWANRKEPSKHVTV